MACSPCPAVFGGRGRVVPGGVVQSQSEIPCSTLVKCGGLNDISTAQKGFTDMGIVGVFTDIIIFVETISFRVHQIKISVFIRFQGDVDVTFLRHCQGIEF